jgi:hypothetical protein
MKWEDRYILENLWPGCQWAVGTIFPANFERFDIYPYLFRKLKWHQERKLKEMPKYIKWNNPHIPEYGKIEKVNHWEEYKDTWIASIDSQINKIKAEYFIPSTKEEFEYFVQSQTNVSQ